MIKAYINILAMLFFSWSVYGYCQEDLVLVMLCGTVAVLSFVLRLPSPEKHFVAFERIPLSAIIILSYILGMFWRGFVPVPEVSNSPFPEFTAALQSGSIFAAILIWLRPFSKTNMSRLVFCAWLTVPLSINVPFTGHMMMVFSSFCFIAVAVVILNTMIRPENKKHLFSYARDYILFSTVLIMLTTVMFFGISRTIVAMEQAFFNTMSNYIMPRHYTHFLRISSQLNLINPGISAFDRRPVMEVRVPDVKGVYLKMQVFDEYFNGTWTEPKEISKRLLPTSLLPGVPSGKIMMFTALKNLVPAPEGIIAIKAKEPYSRSQDEIIYSPLGKNALVAEFSLTDQKDKVVLSDAEFRRLTALPPAIEPQIRKIARSIAGDEIGTKAKANRFSKYFQENFAYSLDVGFSADDKGFIEMLTEKKPAYCTYFASALALLLRAEGIPARVAAGFMTNELVDRRNNTFLARVNNAHAWTEVLAPDIDPVTGVTTMSWRALDATPASMGMVVNSRGKSFDLERMFEKMWLAVLRLNALIENLDKDLVKLYLILVLIVVMALINRHKIIDAVRLWFNKDRHRTKLCYQAPDVLRAMYGRYEMYLKKKFGEARGQAETDSEVLARIRGRPQVDAVTVGKMENFVKEFHAARFGAGSLQQPKTLLDRLVS